MLPVRLIVGQPSSICPSQSLSIPSLHTSAGQSVPETLKLSTRLVPPVPTIALEIETVEVFVTLKYTTGCPAIPAIEDKSNERVCSGLYIVEDHALALLSAYTEPRLVKAVPSVL